MPKWIFQKTSTDQQGVRVSDSKVKDHEFTANFNLLQNFAFKIAVKKKKKPSAPDSTLHFDSNAKSFYISFL